MRTSLQPHSTALTSSASVHLDAIRGLAALVVFFGHGRSLFLTSGLHAAIRKGASASPAAASVGHGVSTAPSGPSIGHLAVIVFFVLSGYLVGGGALRDACRGAFSIREYFFRRLTRLWIVLVPVLALCAFFDIQGMRLFGTPGSIYSSPAGSEVLPGLAARVGLATYFSNLAFLQGIAGNSYGTDSSLWSISYEFWFYVFAALLIAVFSSARHWIARMAAGLLLALSVTLCGHKICAYFLVWSLGAGLVFIPRLLPAGIRQISGILASTLVLFVMYRELAKPVNLYRSDLVLGIALAFLIWTILHSEVQEDDMGRLYRKTARSLSRMSYTLYVAHMPLLVFACALMMPAWKRWPMSSASLARLSFVYVSVFALCWLVYRCFERNTGKLRRYLLRVQADRFSWLSSPRRSGPDIPA